MLSIVELSKNFGSFEAVKNISLEVCSGEIFSFLGANGAGKTTTIKMITGQIAPCSGSAKIGGYDICKSPIEAKKLLGIIPDRPTLYEKLTGREFLLFMSRIYKVKSPHRRIDFLLQKYDLEHKADILIENYSHGMKQRIMLCAAQVHAPALLVIDEPTVGLDPIGAVLLKESLKKLASEGTAVFMSTHSLDFAQEISNRVAIIKKGNIVATGTLNELFRKSENSNNKLESLFMEIIQEPT